MTLFKACFRCGSYHVLPGRAFKIHCVEGRTVEVTICRACAKPSVEFSRRRENVLIHINILTVPRKSPVDGKMSLHFSRCRENLTTPSAIVTTRAGVKGSRQ